jgi:hypothetical protein
VRQVGTNIEVTWSTTKTVAVDAGLLQRTVASLAPTPVPSDYPRYCALVPERNAVHSVELLDKELLLGPLMSLLRLDSPSSRYPSLNHGYCDRPRLLPKAGKSKISLS